MTEKGLYAVIELDDNDGELAINVGNQIAYSHSVHGSVGFAYHVECDESAFQLTYNTKYNNPREVAMGMPGSDSAIMTCTLRALRQGRYKVKVVNDFRGVIERVVTYTITVKG